MDASDVSNIMSRPNQPNAQQVDEEVQMAFTITGLDRSDFFSSLFPLHRIIAARLINYLISVPTAEDFKKASAWGRDNINPNLFNYAFTVACLNRSDTKDVLLLSPAETFPDKYVPAFVFTSALEELYVVPEGSRVPVYVDIDTVSFDNYSETRLEYFRHDLGLNVNYYYWHITHLFEAVNPELVNTDRRGELFCYFHQQIIARYNAERYSNGLLQVEPLSNFDAPIPQGYFPKICTSHMSRLWGSRMDNTYLRDLNRPYEGLNITKAEFQRYIDRVCNAIDLGFVLDEKSVKAELNNPGGIDILGNILQSSVLSKNRKYYGDIANMGHAMIAYCHDPQDLNNQTYGVMGEISTCMRDMLFYRWYAFICQIIRLHKKQLPPYTNDQLNFAGIEITSLDVQDDKGANQNLLNTFFDESDFNLKNGLDFQPAGNIFARMKHLNCNNFNYVINVNNNNPDKKSGTMRIFLAQKSNTRDRELTFEELRCLWIELDRFSVNLNPGTNKIVRKSSESSVTIPAANFFEPEAIREKIKSNPSEKSSYCLSGWPSHLLLPKGSHQGCNFILFAMVSNDVQLDAAAGGKINSLYATCASGSSYCGIINRKYPDSRNMGYPFDRPASIDVIDLHNYLTSNMKTQNVIVKFSDTKVA